jgi:hypothetical protein
MDVHILDQPLNEENWEEFCHYTKVVGDLRPFVIDYLALQADFAAVSSAAASASGEMTAAFVHGIVSVSAGIETQAKAQRAVSNYLGAASALRDRAATRLARRHGADSVEAQSLKNKLSELFDKSFAYRVLYALRNHAQHHENPISLVPIDAKRDSTEQMVATVSLRLDPQVLAGNLKLSRKVREELRELSCPDLELQALIAEHMDAHAEIMLTLLELEVGRLVEMAQYAAALHRVLEIPEGVVAVIWEGGDPSLGPQSQKRCLMCGFDELQRVVQLLTELRAIVDRARYLSSAQQGENSCQEPS